MEVADRIVVMNHGLIEQVGKPRDLYERPANEFVMGFIGPVNQLGSAYVRPHDIDLFLEPVDGGDEAMIERVTYLGFEVRVGLVRADGVRIWAQLPRDEAERLEVDNGQIVYARARRERVFVAGEAAASVSEAASK